LTTADISHPDDAEFIGWTLREQWASDDLPESVDRMSREERRYVTSSGRDVLCEVSGVVMPGRRRRGLEAASRSEYRRGMTPEEIADLAHLRRARDFIDRNYALPLDVPAMARTALMSPAHFSRRFRAAYGETPYSYLMTRRIERAKALLRHGRSVTDTCVSVGCTSLGSFSSRFTEIVGVAPSLYRSSDQRDLDILPPCVSMLATRPRRNPVTV
jgi:AraC-like DNA-binding protein